MRYKPGKDYIIPDTLSRLASINRSQLPDYHSELDVLFTSTLVEIDDSFRKKLVDGYEDDAWWRKVKKQISNNLLLGEDAALIPFQRGDQDSANKDLIFYVNRVTGYQRLCIPPIAVPDILIIAYGEGY